MTIYSQNRISRKNATTLSTINKANRTGSQPVVSHTALLSLPATTPSPLTTTTTSLISPSSSSAATATQQSTAIKQAQAIAAANSKANRETLETIQTKLGFILERQDELLARQDRHDAAQSENKASFEKIFDMLTRLAVSPPCADPPRSRHFSDESIEKAAEVDIDLTKPLSWMGPLGKVKLMEIPFNNMNGNLFGTKSISKLFETIELMQGYIEPSETQTKYVALDQERIDLIKRCYIKHLGGDVDKFLSMWPTIRAALRQKCRDIRRSSNGANLSLISSPQSDPLPKDKRPPGDSDLDDIELDHE